MPTENTEFFGRFLASMLLLLSGIVFGLMVAGGFGPDVYTSSATDFTEDFPPWTVSGAQQNGTTTVDGDLTINGSESGVYTYTSPVIEKETLTQITNFAYSSNIRDEQSITLRIFTSDNNFKTIENSETYTLDDGIGEKVVHLPREKDYRFQVLLQYTGSGQEPELESLYLSGASYSNDYDFSIFFEMIPFWLFIVASLIALAPRSN